MGRQGVPFSAAAPPSAGASMILVHKKAILTVMSQNARLLERNGALQAGLDQAFVENQALMKIAALAKKVTERYVDNSSTWDLGVLDDDALKVLASVLDGVTFDEVNETQVQPAAAPMEAEEVIEAAQEIAGAMKATDELPITDEGSQQANVLDLIIEGTEPVRRLAFEAAENLILDNRPKPE